MYLLDTNICIYIINKRPPEVFARLQTLGYGEVAVSSITGAELDVGVSKSGSARNRAALEKFLAPLEVLPFDAAAMRAYGPLRADLQRRGQAIGALDTLIAAHALAVKAKLVTNNEREFRRVPGLSCENWVNSQAQPI